MATAFNKEVKSNRLLQSRRYTLGSFIDSDEPYTNVFDLGAGEIYTQTNYIPTSSLPFSGSSQDFYYYTTGSTISNTATGNDILRYWSKHRLTPGSNSAEGNQVWFFISGSTVSSIGEQTINANQQTNFIYNKYIEPNLAFNHAENATPGYNIIAYASNNGSTFTEIPNTKYVFDYKTGIFQWLTEANKNEFILNSNYFVYVSAYQYVGKTLKDQIADGSIGGGDSSWNNLSGIPSGLVSSSAQLEAAISGSWQGQGFISGAQVTENLPTGVISGSAQIASDISGSWQGQGFISGAQVTENLPTGVISGSSQIASDISGSWQGQGFISGAQVTENLPAGILSSSTQIASDISGSTKFTIEGSNSSFTVGQEDTIKFISGSARITVLSNGSDTITIGASTDNVTFSSVTANLTGTASWAEKINITDIVTGPNSAYPITFVSTSNDGVLRTDNAGLTYNPLNGNITIGAGTSNSSNVITLGSTQLSVTTNTNPFEFISYSTSGFTFRSSTGTATHPVRITGSLLVTGSSTLNGNSTINGNLTVSQDVTISGNLIVQGTTTTVDTENLVVEDKFIFINSSSTAPVNEGGIIVRTNIGGSGSAFFYDSGLNRWLTTAPDTVTSGISGINTALTSSYTVAVIETGTNVNNATITSSFGSSGNPAYGAMFIDTDNGDIFIYSV